MGQATQPHTDSAVTARPRVWTTGPNDDELIPLDVADGRSVFSTPAPA